MKPSSVLVLARRKIERGWCKDVGARDIYGNEVEVHSPRAASFCALGAIEAIEYDGFFTRTYLRRAIGDMTGIMTWNDSRYTTKEQVIEAFKKAEALARSEGQ